MRTNSSSRRSFLKGTLAATATVGASTLASPTSAAARKSGAQKKVITRPGEPLTPTSLFSPATQLGNLLFLSGSGAHDPQTHKVVPGPIGNQVKQCLENLKVVLEAAGSSMNKVLKCTVFLTDITDFPAMNEVYRSYFPANPPARTTIAAKNLPGNSPVEIECIAYV
ncbi:MAG TPA: Rid family detoxifying hydrolase [Terriglobia bacterium]|nr:Rid family detoxifying hydrolase [Terriglobia bacterium]